MLSAERGLAASAALAQPKVEQDPALPLSAAGGLSGTVAVAGVVVAGGVEFEITPAPAEADDWAASLYAHLLARSPQVSAVAAPVVADLSGPAAARVLEAYAKRQPLPAQALADLQAAVPQARYLALARIESDELTYHTTDLVDPITTQREARPSDMVREQENVHRPHKRRARRSAAVTLDVHELATGRTVWSARVERRREIVIDHFSPEKAGDLKVAPPDSAGALPTITAPGNDLSGLEMSRLVDDCVGALVADLFAAPADPRQPD
jgi:hypothetical protein